MADSDSGAVVYTIGHSTGSMEELLTRLAAVGVQAVADVRSTPYSGRMPWFNRDDLERSLAPVGIQYVFLGRELGGRGSGPGVIGPDGRVHYDKIAASSAFEEGLARVIAAHEQRTIALLCSEGDPMNCHRALLVGRQLRGRGVPVRHIHPDGHTETQRELEGRLLDHFNIQPDLLRSDEERLDEAYTRQEERVAYRERRPHGAGEAWPEEES